MATREGEAPTEREQREGKLLEHAHAPSSSRSRSKNLYPKSHESPEKIVM